MAIKSAKQITIANPRKFFPNYVGQKEATSALASQIEARLENPNYAFSPVKIGGMAGQGKTELAKACAKALEPAGFDFVEIPNDITMPQLATLWGASIQGKQCVLFMDECHNLKRKNVIDTLKRLLEWGNELTMDVKVGDAFWTSDARAHWWITASNMDTTDAALFGHFGRFEDVLLNPFSEDEMREVFTLMGSAIHAKFHKEALDLLIARCMPNGRSIRRIIKKIPTYVRGENPLVTADIARALIKQLHLFPLGLDATDIQMLEYIEGSGEGGRQVQEIAIACNGLDKSVARDRINMLCGMQMLKTVTSGRKALHVQGTAYLEKLRDLQKKSKAKAGAKTRKVASDNAQGGAQG